PIRRPRSSDGLVCRMLDLLGLCLLKKRFARHRVSGGNSGTAVDLLSRSTAAISRAATMEISGDLRFDCCSVAHLGRMAFSGLFSVSAEYRMVGASARAHR